MFTQSVKKKNACPMILSKSQYIRGLQCHKSLWLYKKRLKRKGIHDHSQETLPDTEANVGWLARELFPNGVEVVFDADDFAGMIAQTHALIESGAEVIYEATFQERGIFVMVDILVKNGDVWDIYGVKASTRTKAYHLDDTAIQWYALTRILPLGRARLAHLNSQYSRRGELDIEALFAIDDITETVLAKQATIPATLSGIKHMLEGEIPEVDIGKHCNSPYCCDNKSQCWAHIPAENSVFELCYAMGKQWDLYKSGILHIDDIPESYALGPNASLQIAQHRSREALVDRVAIRDFMGTIHYPINFIDFETFQESIPRFDGQHPYAQIPFQYSLHIRHKDGTLEHKEFLGDERCDPREALIEQLLTDLTPTGSIVAYNQSFEITQIKNLALHSPDHNEALLALIERFVDLAKPFRKKYYYHPKFKGKYSIKAVLPTLFANHEALDYKQLGSIQNGSDATHTFANLHRLKDRSHKEVIRRDLLAYCHLGTLAMVKIWEFLKI